MSEDFYKILGVKRDAGQEEIKKVYRKLARKWHPDINPGNKEAEQRFKDISMAYDALGNEEKRKRYDEFGEEGLQAGFDAEKARKYRQWDSFRQGGRGGSGTGFGQYQRYEDIFGDVFGSGSEGGFRFNQAFGGARTGMRARGRDLEHEMSIDLISALKGFGTELSMQKIKPCSGCGGAGMDPQSSMTNCAACGGSGRLNVAQGPMQFTKACPQCQGHGKTGSPCPQCGGSGQVQGRENIRVTIPKGVKEGSKVRVAGKGEPGLNGGPSGDLYLIIHVKPHPFLRREGDDLHMDVPVTVFEAMAGATIAVPMIDGQLKVKVPPKSQNGQKLRLKGKGADNTKTKGKGDFFVNLIVKVPKTDDKEILEAAAKMDKVYGKDLRGDIRL